MIEAINISKIYNEGSNSQVHALRNVSINIKKGDFIAIRGRSGSGKSTLLNVLGCLDRVTSGKIIIDNIDISRNKDKKLSLIRNKKMGFVLQDFGLIGGRTVLDNVSIPLVFGDVKQREIKGKCMEALKLVGVDEFAKKIVNQLSGGQKQRVAIARAIVNNPEVILADEPTGALDTHTAIEILEMLKHLNKNGKTLIIVSHDNIVCNYCNRTVNISDGSITVS
ncbi:MAG: ABC transporter ATP-binding protein [Clostridiaceae bacterium]|nr:ABC transporter ATP-binding protein [Clostridiaceae bacterium]